eukprot:3037522-Rhodomonas_salina.1
MMALWVAGRRICHDGSLSKQFEKPPRRRKFQVSPSPSPFEPSPSTLEQSQPYDPSDATAPHSRARSLSPGV